MKFILKLINVSLIFITGLLIFSKNAKSQSAIPITEPVKIGLLIQDSNSVAARNGAELAVREANASGGLNNRPFVLLVRDLEGPWGTGSKQAVNLIFDEKVWALIGSHDGRNAHLVEQAATKSQIVFMSAWAADPTLSQAFVPWFFNMMHNDNQQATALADEIFSRSNQFTPAVISDEDYDSGSSLKSFLGKIQEKGKPTPLMLTWNACGGDPGTIADKLAESDINALVIFCQPKHAISIIRTISQRNIRITVFGTQSLLNEDKLSEKDLHGYSEKLVVASGNSNIQKMKAFTEEYRKSFGKDPGSVAIYTYDGMCVLLKALKNAGTPDREKIQNYLKNISYEGISGTIRFDAKGNRNDRIGLVNIRDGIPSGIYH